MSTLTHDILKAVYTCVAEFNESYARIIDAPREHWASMMDDAFGMLINHHMEILRLAQIVAESTNQLPYPVIPETFTRAINAGTNVHLKSQRSEAFKAMCQQITKSKRAPKKTRILTYTFTEQDLHELSYVIPGQHGWIIVYQDSEFQRFLGSTDRFCLELQIPGSIEIPYGEYRAKTIPGQAMSGVEFSQLSDMTRNSIANSICAARGEKKGIPEFRTIMEDLLHSRITLTCVFLECIKGPTTEPRTSTPPPTSNVTKCVEPVCPMDSSMLPFRDPTVDLAPRLIRTESDGFEMIDDALINFPSICRRKHPFGAIGDSRQAPCITTSTPNISVGDSEVGGAGAGAFKSLPQFSFSQYYVHEEGPVNGKNASFNDHEPLRAIQLNGQSSSPFERIPSMASSLPLPYKNGLNNNASVEYSFSNDQDSPFGMLSCFDYEYADDPRNSHYSVNLEQENRPSSALAGIASGGQAIWENCRLRKMCSAPSIPREIEIQSANANATFSGIVTSVDGERERKEVKLFW